MSYKVVRIKTSIWGGSFRKEEDDTSFNAESYPDLDEYLTTMEERGWQVVNTTAGTTESGLFCLFVTLHRPDVCPV